MIESIDITGIKYEIDVTTKKYVMRKIGRLDRYLPRHARKTASADVRLRLGSGKNGNKYEAEVTLTIPDKTLTASDSTVNMLAAVDIVESKLVSQLHRYKTERVAHIGKRNVMSRFKRSYEREKQ